MSQATDVDRKSAAANAPLSGDVKRLLDLSLTVRVVLAERLLAVDSVLGIRPGTIIEFDVPFDAELLLYAGNCTVGYGQAVKVGEKFGLREGRWKYIEGAEEGTRELFDLSNDPGEKQNLADRHPERVAAMAARIREWRSANSRAYGTDRAPSIEDQMRLEALGYVE